MVTSDAGEKVMHANLRIGDSTVLVSDGDAGTEVKSRDLRCRSIARTRPRPRKLFGALSKAARCRCRWARRSLPRRSAWWPTVRCIVDGLRPGLRRVATVSTPWSLSAVIPFAEEV